MLLDYFRMTGPILTAVREAGYFSCCHHSIIHPARVLAVYLLGTARCWGNGGKQDTGPGPWSLVPGLLVLPISVVSQDVVLDHHTGMDHMQVLESPGAGAY